MNRKFKHGMSMAVAMLSALFINTACTDEWDDHYNDNGTNATKTSILDIIRQDSDLSNFRRVIDSMNVSSTKNGITNKFNFADSLFNQSRVYTLWAPTNDCLDADACEKWLKMLEANANGEKPGRDDVFKQLVGAHVSEYIKAASDTLNEDNMILLINKKLQPFVGGYDADLTYTFGGIQLAEKNIRASNGLVHKIGGCADYLPSIWEYLKLAVGETDSVAEFVYSFNKREFNPYASMVGPTVNGQATYLDSAFTNSNQWLRTGYNNTTAGFGDITDEDSTYIAFVPSNQLWENMVPQIKKYFNYHAGINNKGGTNNMEATLAYNDSFSDFMAKKILINHMVFSPNQQLTADHGHTELVVDSMRSTYLASKRRFLFHKNDLYEGTRGPIAMSNGEVYLKDVYNFNKYDMWHDTIIVQAENSNYHGVTLLKKEGDDQTFTVGVKNDAVSTYYISKDNMYHVIDSANRQKNLVYVEAEKASTLKTASLTWTIPNVLAGSYYVGAVIVPKYIEQAEGIDSSAHEKAMSNKMKLTVKANINDEGVDVSNSTKANAEGVPQILAETTNIQNDPAQIDTIWIMDADDPTQRGKVKFRYCEYGLEKEYFTATVTLETLIKSLADSKKYDAILRVDLIILEPTEDDEVPAEGEE